MSVERFFWQMLIEATFRGEILIVRAGESLSIPTNAPNAFTN